jgi:hypothetical protein
LPYGYCVEYHFATSKWLLAHGYGHHGGWSDFLYGPGKRLGKAYICSEDPLDEQYDTLVHETYHAVTDWSGKVRKIQRRVQHEMQETAAKIAAEEGRPDVSVQL